MTGPVERQPVRVARPVAERKVVRHVLSAAYPETVGGLHALERLLRVLRAQAFSGGHGVIVVAHMPYGKISVGRYYVYNVVQFHHGVVLRVIGVVSHPVDIFLEPLRVRGKTVDVPRDYRVPVVLPYTRYVLLALLRRQRLFVKADADGVVVHGNDLQIRLHRRPVHLEHARHDPLAERLRRRIQQPGYAEQVAVVVRFGNLYVRGKRVAETFGEPETGEFPGYVLSVNVKASALHLYAENHSP